jgi:hypothetical protein
MGGSDASNTDLRSQPTAPGGKWVDTGPHMMVLNIATAFEGYPTTAATPKSRTSCSRTRRTRIDGAD